MKKITLGLLTNEQVNNLEVFKNRDVKIYLTDYAILTGAHHHVLGEEDDLLHRTGSYWLQDMDKSCLVSTINYLGYANSACSDDRYLAIRPVILPSEETLKLIEHKKLNENGIYEVAFGEYPQKTVDNYKVATLERMLKTGKMRETGKTYTFDGHTYDDASMGFSPISLKEYMYDNKKYVRMDMIPYFDDRYFSLSNEQFYRRSGYTWLEVTPLKWLVDEKTGLLISKYGLVSGVCFHKPNEIVPFEKTGMYHYLNTYMVKELESSTSYRRQPVIPEHKDVIESLTTIEDKLGKLDPNGIYFTEELAILRNYLTETIGDLKVNGYTPKVKVK